MTKRQALSPSPTISRLDLKWGKAVIDRGFVVTPSLLLRHQATLGISNSELVAIFQISDYWWGPDGSAWPAKATIATRMGCSPGRVQKIVASLERKGYVRRRATPGQTNIYDLSGLVEALSQLESTLPPRSAEDVERHR